MCRLRQRQSQLPTPMNALVQKLQYPLGDSQPELGETMEVAPGVRWIRMALPFALDHINLWLLRDRIDGREGWTVVDTCISRDEAKEQWEQVFATQLQDLPILRVIVTHMHPDHIGLAWWLCERWNAPLWISATDFNAARVASKSTIGFGGESAALFFAAHGLTAPKTKTQNRNHNNNNPSMVPDVPRQFRRMQDGDTIRI